jgi:hypothetical protein
MVIKYLVTVYQPWFSKKQLPEPNIHLKLLGLCWFFHETRWFFEVSEIPNTDNSLNLIFSNTQNVWFFDSDTFQILGADGSLILIFFKYNGYYKNQVPALTRCCVIDHPTCKKLRGKDTGTNRMIYNTARVINPSWRYES